MVKTSTLLKELMTLNTTNGNDSTYTSQNGEATLNPHRNLLTLQDVYKPQKTFTNSTQNYHDYISQELEFKGGVLSQNTPVTPCTHLPVSTIFHHNPPQVPPQFAAICRNLSQSAISAKFCQVRRILLNS